MATLTCAVVGDPVAHSLSPALHAAGRAVLCLDGEYGAHRVPAGTLRAFVAALDPGWRGLSVTMPLKREALELADDADAVAVRAGGVNTLVLEPAADGRPGRVVHGHNTDVPGAVAALTERGVAPRTVTVLGGGATAASLALAACDLGATRVRVLVREAVRASATAAAVAAHPASPAVEVADLAPAQVVGDLVVSTVPADAQDRGLVEACTRVPDAVFEALYDPWPTPLAAAATSAGVPVVGGLDLLVHQAVLQLGLFAGAPLGPVDAARCVDAMRDAGLAVLRARGE